MRSSSCCPTMARHSAPIGHDAAENRHSPEIWNSIWGHGTSVMSPHQYQVLLAMRACGRARLPGNPTRTTPGRSSLEDIGRRSRRSQPARTVGQAWMAISLLPYLADPESSHGARFAHPLHGNGFQHARRCWKASTVAPAWWMKARTTTSWKTIRAGSSSDRTDCRSSCPRNSARRCHGRRCSRPYPGWTDRHGVLPVHRPPFSAATTALQGPPDPAAIPKRHACGTPSSGVSRGRSQPPPTCPECEPGQGLAGRSMGAFPLI